MQLTPRCETRFTASLFVVLVSFSASKRLGFYASASGSAAEAMCGSKMFQL